MSISTIKVSELEGLTRIDSEYYQPNYLELIDSLEKAQAKPLYEIAEIVKRKFEPVSGKRFNYIEISQVDTQSGYVNASEVNGEEAPSRAQYVVLSGDVIISSVRPNRNAVVLITPPQNEFVCSSGFVVLRPKNVSSEFLFASLKSEYVRILLDRQTTATMYPAVSESDLIETPIILPPKSIVSRMEEKVKQAKQLEIKSKQLYTDAENLLASELGLDKVDLSESLFNVRTLSDVLKSNRVDAEHFRQKYYRVLKAMERLEPKSISPLGELTDTLTNGHTPLYHDLDTGDTPFFTAEHVYDFRLDHDNARRIWKEAHESILKRTQLRNDDVLITIKGRVGNAAVVYELPTATNINQDVALLRLKPGINPWYVVGFLNCPAGKALTEQIATGQINPFLGLGNLTQVQIPIFDEKRMNELGEQIRKTVQKAESASQEAKRLLAEAKAEVEKMIEGE